MRVVSSLSAGCCVLVIAAAVAWIAFIWIATGMLVDWANAHFAMGLSGGVLLVFHILAFIVANAVLGRISGSARVTRS